MDRQFELKRMRRLLADLEGLAVRDSEEISEYAIKDGADLSDAICSAEGWTAGRISEPWNTLDAHRWFRTTLVIPERMRGEKVIFSVRTGREGQWDATNPQMLLYLDGHLIQAADVNHRELRITDCAEAGETHELAMLAYSGSVPGDLILHTCLEAVDERVRRICYDIRMPLEAASLIYHTDEDNCRRILAVLTEAGDLLDLRVPYSEDFYASLERAERVLKDGFYTKVNEDAPVVSAVGHTHIDVAWLWSVSQTREKALRSFSTVLSLMEQYPDYTFMSSQPVLYQFVKEQDPEIYEGIRRRVAEGRWETDGAMWLEADCNLTGGESLVRQILKGRDFFLKEFGKESRCLWLPDAFGYSGALPQILKKSGISYFMTTKISWNQYNQLPNDMFLWRGIDGTEIFTFMPTACDFDSAKGLNISFSDTRNTTTYTGVINPNMLLGTHRRFQNHDLTENTLMLYGFGDGGGGPTAEMLENAERLKYGLPGFPRIRLEGEREFFDRVFAETAEKRGMPVWDGELYFEYHRGTLTSMEKNKRNNRRAETLYEQLETLAAIASAAGYEYPEEVIRSGWDVILLNQFHDILPGTCIEAVYDRTDAEYARILEAGEAEARRAADAVAEAVIYAENAAGAARAGENAAGAAGRSEDTAGAGGAGENVVGTAGAGENTAGAAGAGEDAAESAGQGEDAAGAGGAGENVVGAPGARENAASEAAGDVIVVVNTTGYRRDDIVTVPQADRRIISVRDAQGRMSAVQHTGAGAVFFAEGLPPTGYRKFYPVYREGIGDAGSADGRPAGADRAGIFGHAESAGVGRAGVSEYAERAGADGIGASGCPEGTGAPWNGTYENRFYSVVFNDKMQITSLVEKTDGREYIRAGKTGNFLCTYEDRPMDWDNWDIDEYYKRKPYEADWISAPVLVEDGEVETVVEYSLGFGESVVTQRVCFYRDLPRIDFRTTARWNTHHVLLRVDFPVDVNATRASFEIQFGNVERETTRNQSWDSAKFEVCGHRWADLSEYNGGVSLLNDCKYGYSAKDGTLSLTLIKSGTYPNPNADIGSHAFTYSIYPHYGRWQEARTVEMAYDLNVPLFVSVCRGGKHPACHAGQKGDMSGLPLRAAAVPRVPESLISFDRGECFLETVKRSEDGKDWIVRMYEHHNCHVKTAVRVGIPVSRVEECDLLERRLCELPVENNAFTASFCPFEIKTFRLVL